MQTSCLCPSPDFARKQVFGKNLPLPQGAGNTDYTVMLNLFQHLSFLQLIPHPYPLSWICSTLTETRQKACSLVVSFRSLSGLASCRPSANPPPTQERGKRYVCIIKIVLQKEKLFEDNSVSRAEACSENDFSFCFSTLLRTIPCSLFPVHLFFLMRLNLFFN